MSKKYVHGYDDNESVRLRDQAATLMDILHSDTSFSDGSLVLEAGCGVGAQTVALASGGRGAQIISVDISASSLLLARENTRKQSIGNVRFANCDIFNLPFRENTFDHLFICFVLEHLPNPVEALALMKKLVKPGGSVTVIEGDHGSVFFHPEDPYAHQAVNCQVELQKKAGGNALIGRELYPLLSGAGYENVRVSPRMVYVDSSRPGLVEGFTKNTFTAMIRGIREKALQAGLIDEASFQKGIDGLCRTMEKDGVFCYTFFKAFARKPL